MAGADGSPLRSPERTLARTYAREHALAPPVNVREEVARHADLVEQRLPGTAEAVVLRKEAQRPLVIFGGRGSENRQRFTLAHELGHLVMPWQVGSAFCHPDATYVADGKLHNDIEREANEFATELLLPSTWLENELASVDGPLARRILDISNQAQVSPIVATIALRMTDSIRGAAAVRARALPQPYVSSTVSCPLSKSISWWDCLDEVGAAGAEVSRVSFGSYELVAVEFRQVSLGKLRRPKHLSTDVLQELLADFPSKQRAGLLNSVNGVVGAANPKEAGSVSVKVVAA